MLSGGFVTERSVSAEQHLARELASAAAETIPTLVATGPGLDRLNSASFAHLSLAGMSRPRTLVDRDGPASSLWHMNRLRRPTAPAIFIAGMLAAAGWIGWRFGEAMLRFPDPRVASTGQVRRLVRETVGAVAIGALKTNPQPRSWLPVCDRGR